MNREDLKEAIYESEKKIERKKRQILDSPGIPERNKELILGFHEDAIVRGLSGNRQYIYLNYMGYIGLFFGKTDFSDADEETIKETLKKIETSKKYKDWTKENMKTIMILFFKWLNKGELPGFFPKIQRRTPPSKLTRDELISREEVVKLIRTTSNPMYKALISIAYEGALRPGEALNLRVGDVKFNSRRVDLYVNGKTSRQQGPRRVWLFNSYDFLKAWIEQHPLGKPESPLWVGYKKRPLKVDAFTAYLTKLGRTAELTKPVYPYLLRHSRATILYKELGEALAKKYMGHAPDSRMARVYSHLIDEDVLEAVEQIHGIAPDDSKKELEFNVCSKCKHPNSFTADLCSQCGYVLNLNGVINTELEAEITETDKGILEALKTPELRDAIIGLANGELKIIPAE